MRVLIIDDSEIALQAMSSVLSAAGHVVHQASCAIWATHLIARHQIDVVVVDLVLDAFRGERFVELLRKIPRLNGLGIVLVSGQAEEKVEFIRAAIGADAGLSKRNLKQLPHAVSRAFDARRAYQAEDLAMPRDETVESDRKPPGARSSTR